jgi:hypothetical protein
MDEDMAEIKNPCDLILHCQMVNVEYMRLPAGHVDGYKNLVNLYKRIAKQGLDCALYWANDTPCPEHEPAVDAFFWAVVSWAEAFGQMIPVDPIEWARVVVRPHIMFAKYLRPGEYFDKLPILGGPAADIILRLDALWMERVVKLTAKWGLLQHMKDLPAVTEARCLDAELKKTGSPAYLAYLESDLKFFYKFFEPFPLTKETRLKLEIFLDQARLALEPYEGGEDDD